jgi:DNA-binding transcriptional LysR family regulator
MLDGVSLEQLLFFIAAAEEGSFSAAGRRLKRAQSVVSQTVSNLEGHLGMRLFDRTARFPALTVQGRALLANARAVTSQMDLLKARVKGLAGGSEPDLTMAVDPTLPISIFTEAASALREQFPETAIRLHVEGWGAAIQYVLDGRCAIGITASLITTPPELAREPLMEVRMATVVSSLHPLASYRRPIPAAILAKHIQLIHTDRLQPSAGPRLRRAVTEDMAPFPYRVQACVCTRGIRIRLPASSYGRGRPGERGPRSNQGRRLAAVLRQRHRNDCFI